MVKSIPTVKLSISSDKIDSDVSYFLNQFPFLGLEEQSETWIWYWEVESWENHGNDVQEYLNRKKIIFESEYLEGENWNANWEKSFSPVFIDSFCQIRAHFHNPLDGFEHDIVIDPKMAFGTGHHDTTYQMMAAMALLNFKNSSIVDLGTGTGVLAILAEKMGASNIIAIDNDPSAIENSIENAKLNSCNNIDIRLGDVSVVMDEIAKSDILLANINRNVLLELEPVLASAAKHGTELVLSGILRKDKQLILDQYANHWQPQIHSQKGDWVCIYGKKS